MGKELRPLSPPCQAPVRRVCMPQDNVTAPLVVKDVTDLPQRADHLTARDTRQLAHTVTSTTSSEMDGGPQKFPVHVAGFIQSVASAAPGSEFPSAIIK